MALQPGDVFDPRFDDEDFNNLDGKLQSFIYIQADNSNTIDAPNRDSSSPLLNSLALTDVNNVQIENSGPAETSSFDQSPEFDDQLFPEAMLGESSLLDPLYDLLNEVTITATTTEAEDNSTSKKDSISTADKPTNACEQMDSQSVGYSHQEQLLSVISHPVSNPRRRYTREGKRRMKKLYSNSLILDLSKVKNRKLRPNVSIWLRLSLITINEESDNPFHKVCIHPDQLKSFSGTIQVLIDGSICILVTQANLDEGRIELKDLTIVKRLQNAYDFKLVLYSLSEIGKELETYKTDASKKSSANVRMFRQIYNLKASRIACQILFKENQSWYFSEIACVTNVMIEQEYEPKTTKPKKRLVKKNRKSAKKRRNIKRNTRTRY